MFSLKDRLTAVRKAVAGGGTPTGVDRGGSKDWSSPPSALCFAVGEWFVARRRVASSYPFCAANPWKQYATLSACVASKWEADASANRLGLV